MQATTAGSLSSGPFFSLPPAGRRTSNAGTLVICQAPAHPHWAYPRFVVKGLDFLASRVANRLILVIMVCVIRFEKATLEYREITTAKQRPRGKTRQRRSSREKERAKQALVEGGSVPGRNRHLDPFVNRLGQPGLIVMPRGVWWLGLHSIDTTKGNNQSGSAFPLLQ